MAEIQVYIYDGCFQDSLNLFQLISQPFINGFCFNMAHLNELHLVIRMNEYSLREEVIRIFEYSNHSLETLPVTILHPDSAKLKIPGDGKSA